VDLIFGKRLSHIASIIEGCLDDMSEVRGHLPELKKAVKATFT